MREENSTSSRWLWVGGLLTATLLAFIVSQQGTIREQAEQVLHLTGKVTTLETQLTAETAANEQLRAENEALTKEVATLHDSITLLSGQVRHLKVKLKKHQATIAGIRAEMAKKEAELKSLRAELERYRHNPDRYSSQIEDTRANITVVEGQTEQLQSLQTDEVKQADHAENQMVEQELALRQKETLEGILNHTTVTVKAIKCSENRSSKPLKKLADDGSTWAFTTVQFDLDNEDQARLADQYFVLKIINHDTNEPMPFIEGNAAYANAPGTIGLTFQWKQNPMSLVFINMQAKKGINYDLAFYLKLDDKEYIIPGSSRTIIENGRMVSE